MGRVWQENNCLLELMAGGGSVTGQGGNLTYCIDFHAYLLERVSSYQLTSAEILIVFFLCTLSNDTANKNKQQQITSVTIISCCRISLSYRVTLLTN